MPAFLGVPVDAAYHVVSALTELLAPLLSGLAAPAAIVLFTMAVRLLLVPLSYRATQGMEAQARIAPRSQALRNGYAGQPDKLRRELTALYESEGTSTLAGCVPTLLQWPFLSIMYLVFRSPRVGGAANTLLAHDLFGAPLGGHWLGGAGPFSAQGAVFAGLFAVLAGLGWLSARTARRHLAARAERPGPSLPVQAGERPAAVGAGEHQVNGAASALARLAPYMTVAVAAFMPLAAGLYLAATTAWTLGERRLLYRAQVAKQAKQADSS